MVPWVEGHLRPAGVGGHRQSRVGRLCVRQGPPNTLVRWAPAGNDMGLVCQINDAPLKRGRPSYRKA